MQNGFILRAPGARDPEPGAGFYSRRVDCKPFKSGSRLSPVAPVAPRGPAGSLGGAEGGNRKESGGS